MLIEEDLPRAFWEKRKIVIVPRPSELERNKKLFAWTKNPFVVRIELRPMTLTNRREKTKVEGFKAMLIYNDGKEEIPTAYLLNSFCPEQGETWAIWRQTDKGKQLFANKNAATKWLSGGEKLITWPCILQQDNSTAK